MRLSIPFALGLAFIGCGDDSKTAPDAAKPPPDGAPDAAVESPLTLLNNEGGEIRLEWISNATATGPALQARMGAYFYKSETPAKFALPAFPGCVDMRQRDKWPLAQGTITYLDVGGVTLVPKTGQPFKMVKDQTVPATKDAFQRPHDLWWKKVVPPAGTNDADTYLPGDESYDIVLQGSAEWPHQVLKDAAFMPANWVPTSPAPADTAMLVAGTDFTFTFTPVVSANLPPGVKVNTVMGFTGNPNTGPVVVCQEEGTDGSITVPAALVDIIRASCPTGVCRYIRQNLTHQLFELTDGSPRAEADRKRVDVLTIWCYNSPWIPAP
jgi:hypothetical protein